MPQAYLFYRDTNEDENVHRYATKGGKYRERERGRERERKRQRDRWGRERDRESQRETEREREIIKGFC